MQFVKARTGQINTGQNLAGDDPAQYLGVFRKNIVMHGTQCWAWTGLTTLGYIVIFGKFNQPCQFL